jgi:hypothetical protein
MTSGNQSARGLSHFGNGPPTKALAMYPVRISLEPSLPPDFYSSHPGIRIPANLLKTEHIIISNRHTFTFFASRMNLRDAFFTSLCFRRTELKAAGLIRHSSPTTAFLIATPAKTKTTSNPLTRKDFTFSNRNSKPRNGRRRRIVPSGSEGVVKSTKPSTGGSETRPYGSKGTGSGLTEEGSAKLPSRQESRDANNAPKGRGSKEVFSVAVPDSIGTDSTATCKEGGKRECGGTRAGRPDGLSGLPFSWVQRGRSRRIILDVPT